jgi:predicted dehydrogenase
MKDISKLNIALIGVSHWHVPLYLRAVPKYRLNVIAVSDENPELAAKVAKDLNCKFFFDADQLLEYQRPDFVFAFAKHCDMPDLARKLVTRGIPFAIEKPLGLCGEDVTAIIELASKNGVFCAIPFIWRYSDLIKQLRRKILPEDILHMSFKFIAGPPSRYQQTSPWMLGKTTAGGGCMTNLGVHFIDLALLLSGSKTAKVESSGFHYGWGYDIEDYAVSILRLENAATTVIETGYAYPMDDVSKRDNLWTIVTKKGYYSLGVGYFETREFGGDIRRVEMDTDSDSYYSVFVYDSLCEYLQDAKPTVGLEEMLQVRKVLDAINVTAAKNGK